MNHTEYMREWLNRPGNRERVKARKRDSYQRNKERVLAQQKEHYRLHPAKKREASRLYHAKHRAENTARARSYRAANPEKVRASQLKSRLKRRYGLSLSEFDAIWERQGGSCAVCRVLPATHVDHDHSTGRVRGLLCHLCNSMLGHASDSPERLRAAAAYLEEA